MRRILLIVLTVALSGCASMSRTGTGIGRKVVAGKEPPATLVAFDGTVCATTPSKFQETKPGDEVWCAWRERGDPGTSPRPPVGLY